MLDQHNSSSTGPDPFIVMCAPNGARRTHSDHPKLPISPTELANCAAEVMAAGASILHLHVRDEHGQHSLDVNHYRRAIDAVTDKIGDGLVIQVTSEAVGVYSRRDQMTMVKTLRPEAVSLALRELVPNGSDPNETADFFCWLHENNVCPQIILYDEIDYQRYQQLQKQGVFGEEALFLLFVVKKQQPEREHEGFLNTAFGKFPPKTDSTWAACCFGKQEHNLAALCAQNAGHVRVGFENNIWREDGTFAANNAELVRNAREAALPANRITATADDARRILSRAQSATINQKQISSLPKKGKNDLNSVI